MHVLCSAYFRCSYLCICVLILLQSCMCMCASASAYGSMITGLAGKSQIAEDMLAKVWLCHSYSLPWRGSRAPQICPQVLTLANTQIFIIISSKFLYAVENTSRVNCWIILTWFTLSSEVTKVVPSKKKKMCPFCNLYLQTRHVQHLMWIPKLYNKYL